MLFFLINLYYAHISMSSPISRRNQLSQFYRDSNNVDYDLRTPLYAKPNNFTFPCKGFPIGPSTTTYNDNTISVTLEGTAVHGGGHCQFGISYDNQNFLVLKTVLNSCLLDTMTYTFNLPNNAPGGDLIVFWTWINRIGNREYYMECADVTVNNGNTLPTKVEDGTLQGKELLIVNILNHPIVPEWELGAPPSIDGRYLFEQRKDITLTINHTNNKYSLNQITSTIFQSTTTTQYVIITPFIKNTNINTLELDGKNEVTNDISDCDYDKLSVCDQDGLMICYENGFYTCANQKWIYRDCSKGTVCKQLGTSILCDFK